MRFRRGSFCVFLILLSVLFVGSRASTAQNPEERISFIPPEKPMQLQDQQVSWNLKPTQSEIISTITLDIDKPGETPGVPGKIAGEIRIEIDGMLVTQDSFTEPNATIEQPLPLTSIADGDHVITLTVRDFTGKLHTQSRTFRLNARPLISVIKQEKDGEIFDPALTFSFFGGHEPQNVGMVDTYLDERPLKSFSVTDEQNHKPKNLSEFLGSGIFRADLTPGTHLLTIVAQGTNGSFATQTIPIPVKAQQAVVSVRYTDNKMIESVEITYPASSRKLTGSVMIHLNHSVILEIHAEKTKVTISRADLLASLEKHNQKTGKEPVSMIISTITANQVENWQEISFQ